MARSLPRIGLTAALMLAISPAQADTIPAGTAAASSQAAFNALTNMPSQEMMLGMADPDTAALLTTIWDLQLLQPPNPVNSEYLNGLNKICLNGMIAWKLYLFNDIGNHTDFESIVAQRIIKYQTEIVQGIIFSLHCSKLLIDTYETASSQITTNQADHYDLWVDKETGWIGAAFGLVCTGNLETSNSNHLRRTLQSVLPGLLAVDRDVPVRSALETSIRARLAEAWSLSGTGVSKDCSDLETFLAQELGKEGP